MLTKSIYDGLSKWRQERSITEPQSSYKSMMEEELFEEFLPAVRNNDFHETVDALCDMIVITINQFSTEQCEPATIPVSGHKSATEIESYLHKYEFGSNNCQLLLHIIDACVNELHSYNVDPNLAMEETIKEISSRRQDQTQQAEWSLQGGNTTGEKWHKDKSQPQSTLYKANYNRCIID